MQKTASNGLVVSVSASHVVGLAQWLNDNNLAVQPDCVKCRIVCGTVYGDIQYKDLMGSMSRVRHRIPFWIST